VVLASNRGPFTLTASALDDGDVTAVPASGGLASGLRPLLDERTVWIAAAVSDVDRAVAQRQGGLVSDGTLTVRLVDMDPHRYRLAYDVVANSVLWFTHHGLFDLPRRPRLDDRFAEAWEAYRELNGHFADAVAEHAPPGAAVLVQDYHLALLPGLVRERRPDVAVAHFSHTPFAGPEGISVLPGAVATEMLAGMAAATACGFHTARWARRFTASCEEHGVTAPATFVAALNPDPPSLRRIAGSDAATAHRDELDAWLGRRRCIVRVERMELSKNIGRGFLAFERLLEAHPDLRGEVCFAAYCYPSRTGVADYLAYHLEVAGLVDRVNTRFATAHWLPIRLETANDLDLAMGGLRRADVVLVNPVRDGLNLVALEAPLVNEREAVLVLSTEAGAHERLGEHALGIHPFDIDDTARALARALDMEPSERSERFAALQRVAASRSPADWLAEQLAALG
jgi:trehalose 6-phosphate synthase